MKDNKFFSNLPPGVELAKLRKRLNRQVLTAISDYKMDMVGRKWLVCLSGGKDSWAMLAVLIDLIHQNKLGVDILACNLDQGQPNFPAETIPDFLQQYDIPHRIEYRDTFSIVKEKIPQGATYCALCSRLRRGNLYRIAREEQCDAVLLGHHREDILETFFLNMFYGGKLAAMAPKLRNDEGDLYVLRPLAYCQEADLERYARALLFPIIPCDLCGSQDGLQRQHIKHMIQNWERQYPGRTHNIFEALQNISPAKLLDHNLLRHTENISGKG
ncbi:MAG: tRNA 2-thiocytidine(32) synthetase TtcA [bacterium]